MPQYPQNFNGQHLNTRLGLGLGVGLAVLVFLLLLKLLLPWILGLGVLAGGWYGWRRHRQAQQRLYRCFYECLQTHQGCISVLDFAMAAHIPGPQARAFLDARAQDFWADFEPTAHGDVLYTFKTAQRSLP